MHLGAALVEDMRGESTVWPRGRIAYRSQANFEYRILLTGSESMDDKVRGREGNSPDRRLRSQIMSKWERRWIFTDNQEVGLEAAIP